MTLRLTLLGLLVIGVGSGSVQAADIFNGKEVYDFHCVVCHGEDGTGDGMGTPDLTQLGALMQSDVSLVEKLADGFGSMPAYRGMLTDAELRDVIAYLRTMR